MPALGRVQEEFRDKGVQVVAVNIDPRTPLAEWQAYWRELKGGEVVWAQDSGEGLTAFDVQFLGTKVILDRQGRVVRKAAGIAGYENLRRWVEEALAAT